MFEFEVEWSGAPEDWEGKRQWHESKAKIHLLGRKELFLAHSLLDDA